MFCLFFACVINLTISTKTELNCVLGRERAVERTVQNREIPDDGKQPVKDEQRHGRFCENHRRQRVGQDTWRPYRQLGSSLFPVCTVAMLSVVICV